MHRLWLALHVLGSRSRSPALGPVCQYDVLRAGQLPWRARYFQLWIRGVAGRLNPLRAVACLHPVVALSLGADRLVPLHRRVYHSDHRGVSLGCAVRAPGLAPHHWLLVHRRDRRTVRDEHHQGACVCLRVGVCIPLMWIWMWIWRRMQAFVLDLTRWLLFSFCKLLLWDSVAVDS